MELVVRASVIFLFLWLLTRALGRRELTELTAFELVVMIVMGDMVQQAVTQEDTSLVGGMLAVGTIGLWVLALSWITYRFKRTRPALEGHAVIVVRDGEPLLDVLRVERVALDEVVAEARNQGIDDLAQVRYAILESDGKFSFLKKDGGRPQSEQERQAS
jgi:uncharacterized membrane protein YcaP (DUF421 family)